MKKEEIKEMIYEINGKRIMLDFELAKLYGYETKNLNRQVKNHIDLFNENILFKLTKNDVDMLLRCKIFTSIMQTEGIKGGRTSLPYAFTLDGIKALSSVLRGPDVISITSMIIEVFNDDNQVLEITEKSLNEAISYEIVKFSDGDVSLDVNVSPNEDTVWLTQEQICKLFDVSKSTLSFHINNIFTDKELKESSTVRFFRTLANNGKYYNLAYYNLDMIISVGYRVNSKRGIQFRQWANNILKQYLIKGYSINSKRCLEHSDIIISLQKDVNELSNQVIDNNKKLDKIEKENKEIKEDYNQIKEYFLDPSMHKHFAIFNGNRIESDIAYQTIYSKSFESIIIIDDYIDVKTLELLKICKKEISITIISDNKSTNNLTNSFINDFIKDTKVKLTFILNKYEFHSRYIIIDYKSNNWLLYHCGGSSKDGGNTINTIIEIPEKEVYVSKIDKVLCNEKLEIK